MLRTADIGTVALLTTALSKQLSGKRWDEISVPVHPALFSVSSEQWLRLFLLLYFFKSGMGISDHIIGEVVSTVGFEWKGTCVV